MNSGRRCLVIHPGALGDVLLALPALAHLGALGLTPVVAVRPRLARLLGGTPLVGAACDFDGLGLHRLFTATPDPAGLRHLASYDALVSWFGAGDPLYTGHVTGLGRPAVVARATPGAGARIHASRYLVDTLAPLGRPSAGIPAVRLEPGAAERAWAAAWLRERGLTPAETILLHPGAGSVAKVWPGFAGLARRLEARGRPVVVSAGPADAGVAARVVAEAGLADVRVAADLPLPRLAALLGEAGAFVGNDSGPSHLAGVVGCPTLALFGPTDPAVWAPIGPAVRVLGVAGAGAGDPWAGLTEERVEAALDALARPAAVAVALSEGGDG